MKLFEKIKKSFCSHKTIMMSGKAEEADITEPNEESRKVKVAIVRTYCKNCDRTFKITPMGVVYDQKKGIDRNFPTKEMEVPPEVRTEVLSEISFF